MRQRCVPAAASSPPAAMTPSTTSPPPTTTARRSLAGRAKGAGGECAITLDLRNETGKYSISLALKNPLRSESGGSVGKLKLSSVMKEKFEAAVTGGGTSRRDSMKSSNEEEVGKLGEDRKKILEQKLRGGGGAGEGSETCCSKAQ